jgi:hypothetical protein
MIHFCIDGVGIIEILITTIIDHTIKQIQRSLRIQGFQATLVE